MANVPLAPSVTKQSAVTTIGLTSAQVAERVARGETNDYQIRVGRTYWQIVRDNVFNVFNIVLAILLGIMLWYGDIINIIFASFSVVVNTIIGLVQEINAKRALDKLAALSVQEVKVWREGILISIPITQIVKDDVMPIEPGDRLPVDGQITSVDSLEMDESLLTGESDPIQKELDNTVYSGSYCIAGSGVMVATQVGANSTINKLSQTAKAYRNVLTPTQNQINAIVQISIFGMALFAPMTLIAGVAQRLPTIEIVRNLLVLVTSFVPQGLVLATTISLVLGALRISRRQTLVQRTNAVESMANVNVLCFDKTGTLTRNQLAVVEIIPLNGGTPDQICEQLTIYTNNLAHLNKTAAAIAQYTGRTLPVIAGTTQPISPELLHEHAKQLEIPFTSARKWGAVVLQDETMYLGAPERVLDPIGNKAAMEQARVLAAEGQRVLAFALSPEVITEPTLSLGRQPLALVVMSDQVRADIRETLNAFTQQKVQLKVISGDNIETVSSIAKAAGMDTTHAYTGDQLEAMSSGELQNAAREGTVFARIEPETKRKIIRAIKEQGSYVAMVGDGVNDVPALKEANMAIAMNDGAQIAKDVADVVLLNNAMSTLPMAFAEGKNITQKIYSTAKLFLTKNFFTILAFIFVGYMSLPFPTSPIQISWLTFSIVNIPAFLITFEILRPAEIPNFQEVIKYVLVAVLVGALGSALLYAIVYLFEAGGIPRLGRVNVPIDLIVSRDKARSALLIFMSLYGLVIFYNTMGLFLTQPRTFIKNRAIAVGGVIVLLVILIIPFIPALRTRIFVFIEPSLEIWGLILVMFMLTVTSLYLGLKNYSHLNFFSTIRSK